MKKTLKRVFYLILLGILVFVVIYAWPRVPIITAFAAKGMCSSVFIAEKEPERVMAEDLSFFPISLAKVTINREEKSATAKVFGLGKRKAVFREGLGAVIVLDTPVNKLKERSFKIPDPGYRQDTIPWPMGDLLPESLPEGIDMKGLQAVVDRAFDKPGEEPFRKTLGVAVVYDGQLITEKYLDGYDMYTEFHGWSMSKSLTSSLVGILSGENRLNVNMPAGFPEWENDERKNITLGDLLHMNSGLKWVENYFTISEATVMLMQSEDMVRYTLEMPLEYSPRSNFRYSSGDANLIAGVIRNEMENDEEYHSFLYKKLMHRIGMLNTISETDAAGNFVASSYSYGTTRDWARYGLLYLNDGIFCGDTVLPPGWVEYTRKEAPNSMGQYGATFWLREPNPFNALVDVPDDVFFADGFLGQRIYIIPSRKLVVVRMGYSMKNFNMNDFLRDIIQTIQQ